MDSLDFANSFQSTDLSDINDSFLEETNRLSNISSSYRDCINDKFYKSSTNLSYVFPRKSQPQLLTKTLIPLRKKRFKVRSFPGAIPQLQQSQSFYLPKT